jgi:Acyl-CoA synthetases (AMP-forming)/AMP-acid ligases II
MEAQAPGPQFDSLCEMLRLLADRFGERPAVGHLGASISFAELDRLSRQFAAWVQHETDLEPGDRIALQLPNLMQYPVVMFGARRAGLVVVNTNPLYCCDELCQHLQDSGARALVALAPLQSRLQRQIATTDVDYLITTELGDLHPHRKRVALNLAVRIKRRDTPWPFRSAPRLPPIRHVRLRQLLQRGSQLFWQPPPEGLEQRESLALLQYTGGTTGPAKGAMLCEKALLANLAQLRALLDDYCKPGQERLLQPLPLYHIYSFMLTLAMLSIGSSIELIPDPRRIRTLIGCWRRFDPTVVAGINPLFIYLCQQPAFQQLDFTHLKLTISGGMALTRVVAQRWQQVTGHPICEGYGLTECSPVVSVNRPDDIHPGSVGRPLPGTEVRIVDEQHRCLPEGEIGSILVRGPQLMQGYWRQQEETQQALRDGWLDTGDIGLIDPQGYLRIIDRRKEVINVSGFKVYPSELENIIAGHPDILECAVIGLPDSLGGEQIKLFVVPANQQLTVKAVREYCRERLTPYKVPRLVEFCHQLPHTPIGKVARRVLRERELKRRHTV